MLRNLFPVSVELGTGFVFLVSDHFLAYVCLSLALGVLTCILARHRRGFK